MQVMQHWKGLRVGHADFSPDLVHKLPIGVGITTRLTNYHVIMSWDLAPRSNLGMQTYSKLQRLTAYL